MSDDHSPALPQVPFTLTGRAREIYQGWMSDYAGRLEAIRQLEAEKIEKNETIKAHNDAIARIKDSLAKLQLMLEDARNEAKVMHNDHAAFTQIMKVVIDEWQEPAEEPERTADLAPLEPTEVAEAGIVVSEAASAAKNDEPVNAAYKPLNQYERVAAALKAGPATADAIAARTGIRKGSVQVQLYNLRRVGKADCNDTGIWHANAS